MIGLLRFCFVLVAGAVLLGNASVQAQVVCPAKPHWSATTPPINIDHVFCGEVDGNRAKGFHSRPGGINPASVADVKITQEPNASGVFGATVTLVNPHGANPSKFSTMFPDSCSQGEVENPSFMPLTILWRAQRARRIGHRAGSIDRVADRRWAIALVHRQRQVFTSPLQRLVTGQMREISIRPFHYISRVPA